jgi:hypothetical protein
MLLVGVATWIAGPGGTCRLVAAQDTAEAASSKVAEQVDTLLSDVVFGPDTQLAPRCDDATFLRRVWLDVVGDIPAPEHVIAFCLDPSGDKRSRVVRELLADPQYGANWARYWRDVIFSRRIEDRALLGADALEADLTAWLNRNDGWDAIAARFTTALGDVRENGATAIVFAQDGRTEEVAAETSRIFLGMQIQCAQCHDHPYDRWKRDQFHELAAFFPRLGVRNVRSATRRTFEVYASDRPSRARNNDGNRPQSEHFMPDLEDPSAAGTRMTPRFFLTSASLPAGSLDAERRETLSEWLTGSPWFAKAAVNRMWAELVGEGFYEPVDDLGPDRTPQAPEVLEALAAGFTQSGYDLKWLLTTICATDAYQRASAPRRMSDATPFTANVPQPLRADQLLNSLLSALDVPEPRQVRPFGGNPQRRGNLRRQFNEVFGYDPSIARESVTGSIPQSLALMNMPQIHAALQVGKKSPLGAALAQVGGDAEDRILEIYLRILCRPPASSELARAQAYLEDVGDESEALEDLAWALVNSAEFRYRN